MTRMNTIFMFVYVLQWRLREFLLACLADKSEVKWFQG